jgi:hypothetical protein
MPRARTASGRQEHRKQRQGAGHEAGDDADQDALPVPMRGAAPSSIEEPGADQCQQTSAHVLNDRRAAGTAKRSREDRRCRERQHNRRPDVGQRERGGDGEAAQDGEPGANEIGREHRLAVPRRQRVDSAEDDAKWQHRQERRPVPRRREGVEVCGDGGVDPALEADQEFHHGSSTLTQSLAPPLPLRGRRGVGARKEHPGAFVTSRA